MGHHLGQALAVAGDFIISASLAIGRPLVVGRGGNETGTNRIVSAKGLSPCRLSPCRLFAASDGSDFDEFVCPVGID